MPTMIVLAMHGAPPTDFPRAELGEYFRLHAAYEASHPGQKMHAFPAETLSEKDEARYQELDERIRLWPRTAESDPFYAGSLELAKALEKHSSLRVIVGFNEFCAPSLETAMDLAVEKGARKVVVVTPMMTSGGTHSEVDIPDAVEEARARFPHVEFVYAWPFSRNQVATFLALQVARHLSGKLEPAGWR